MFCPGANLRVASRYETYFGRDLVGPGGHLELFVPCFYSKRPYFGWFETQKRGQNSSICIYLISIHVQFGLGVDQVYWLWSG